MTLTQYACRPDWKDQSTSELKTSLSDLEKTLANRLTVLEVQGKSRKNPKVPVLLTRELKKAIDLLLEKRAVSDISQQNIFIFARSYPSLGHMRGHDCLKRYIDMIDLQKPDLITSTKLRKYVATTVQLFNLKETETDWLARHLGHDIRIHRDFYRLHESAVELTKVSRILLAIDSGQAVTYAGKSLEEIRLEDLPEPENSDSEKEDDKLEDNGRNEFLESDICGRPSKKSRTGLDIFDEEYHNLGRETENEKKSRFSSPDSQKGVKKKKVPTNTSMKKPWSSSEKNAVLTFFSRDIKKCIVPTKVTAEDCKKQSQGILDSRTWRDIKYCVHNHIVKMKKKT
ncbi:uncharacterized protein isoform X1 [Leptinotarsa decemlineata]|uniref:uncharacterized protein isoform X1 n=1 Tax=Leptinotarsa decemlineata TaxID=7539 RepID=UPI003D30887A